MKRQDTLNAIFGLQFLSLKDMIYLNGGMLFSASQMIELTVTVIDEEGPTEEQKISSIAERMKNVAHAVTIIGLPLTLKKVESIQNLLEKRAKFDEFFVLLRTQVREMQSRFEDELDTIQFFVLTPRDMRTLETIDDPTTVDLITNHTDIKYDVEEAFVSLSLMRYTAAVFHIMRALEYSFTLIATTLKDPDIASNPSWDAKLRKFDKVIGDVKNSGTKQALSDIHLRLLRVKDAWRNPTMHLEKQYKPETAEKICNASLDFIKTFTEKLPQVQAGL